MDAQHLLDQVLFAFDVEPMARGGNGPDHLVVAAARDRVQLETSEDVADFGRWNPLADQTVQAALAQANDVGAWQMGLAHRLHDRPRTAADQVKQETRCPFHGFGLELVVDATLVPVRGVGLQPKPPRRRRNA